MIDLQQAIHSQAGRQSQTNNSAPWESANQQIREAWTALTNPGNALALESLFYQLPEGPQTEMARKAIQICRKRRGEFEPPHPGCPTRIRSDIVPMRKRRTAISMVLNPRLTDRDASIRAPGLHSRKTSIRRKRSTRVMASNEIAQMASARCTTPARQKVSQT